MFWYGASTMDPECLCFHLFSFCTSHTFILLDYTVLNANYMEYVNTIFDPVSCVHYGTCILIRCRERAIFRSITTPLLPLKSKVTLLDL